jgi:hypothetical protein
LQQDSSSYIQEFPEDILVDEKRRRSNRLWNIFTILLLVLMIGLCAVFFMIFTDPESPLNPAPPPTMPVLIVLPTSTATQRALPATWTPTVVTVTPSVTPTTGIQATLPLGTTEPTPTRDLSASAPFVLQGAPMAVADGLFRGTSDCKWMGVAGNVYDLQGRPVIGLKVRLGGVLNGKSITPERTTLTGLARAYGESGYEFKLADQPIASTSALWIRLYDQQDIPISDKTYFDTFNDCAKNLVLVNYKQVR